MVVKSHMMYLPKMGGGVSFRAGKVRPHINIKGKGVGSFLLDGGAGGQNSYDSVDDYTATTGRVIGGTGVASSLAKVGGKIASLAIKKESKKPARQNINFSI